jgi:hypothetical protein
MLGIVLALTSVPVWRSTTAVPDSITGQTPVVGGVTEGSAGMGGMLRLPRGLAATIEVVRMDVEPPEVVEPLRGYVLASTESEVRVAFRLEPTEGMKERWVMKLISEDGAAVEVGFADLGNLTAASKLPQDLMVDVSDGLFQEVVLTRLEPSPGGQRMPLNLRVRGFTRATTNPVKHTQVGGGAPPEAMEPASEK